MSEVPVPAGTLSRAALSRQWHLGMLYNAAKDESILGGSIFSEDKLKKKGIQKGRNYSASHFIETSDTLESKSSNMAVDASLKLSFMAGLVKVEGSGQYLNEKRSEWAAKRVAFGKSVRSHWEMMSLLDLVPDQPHTAAEVQATHVVTAIQYGMEARLIFEHKHQHANEEQEVECRLKLVIETIPSIGVSGKGGVKTVPTDKKDLEKLKVSYIGDANLGFAVGSFEDAVSAYQKLGRIEEPEMVPVEVYMLPLSTFQDVPAVKLMREIAPDIISKVTQEYDKLRDHQLRVGCLKQHQVYKTFEAFRSEVDAFSSKHLDIFILRLQGELQRLLPAIRLGSSQEQELVKLMESIADSAFADALVNAELSADLVASYMNITGLAPMVSKEAVQREAAKPGFDNCLCFSIALGRLRGCQSKLVEAFLSDDTQHTNALGVESYREADHDFSRNGRCFIEFMAANQGNSRMRFLLSVSMHEAGVSGCVQRWQAGKLVDEACQLPVQVRELKQVNSGPHAVEVSWSYPFTSAHDGFKIFYRKKSLATDSSEASMSLNTLPKWEEVQVKNHAARGQRIDQLSPQTVYELYMQSWSKLGMGRASPTISVETTTFPKKREYTVLILGETGVGKSTFINAFCNCITYGSFANAKAAGLQTVMPANFKQMVDGTEHTIKVGGGGDQNENFDIPGASVTQEPKCYPFEVIAEPSNYTLNIIDTPGMGDTRGTEQDKINMTSIVHHLQAYDEIDAILLLLQPNLPRLTIPIRYCVMELFKNLHVNCRKNIFFVFTRSRETMYEPGDTLPNLRLLLTELRERQGVSIACDSTRYFCTDSESFRFLACQQHGVVLKNAREEDYAQSWETSVLAVQCLMRKVRDTMPFSTRQITELFKARMLIIQLTKPLAEVQSNILRRKQYIEQIKGEISKVEDSMEKLKEKLMMKKSFPEIEKLDYPCTVCTHPDCTTLRGDRAVYTTCHEQCQLQGVPQESLHNCRLQGCAAMSSGHGTDSAECKCGHSWRLHMHIYYKVGMVEREVVNADTESKINDQRGVAERKADELDKMNTCLDELSKESGIVEEAAVSMAAFLKHNGICPVNDAVVEYLQLEIDGKHTEMALKQNGGFAEDEISKIRDSIHALERSKTAHKKEVDMLVDRLQKVDIQHAEVSADSILNTIVPSLKQLKHSGEWIRTAMDEFDRHVNYARRETVKQAALYRPQPRQGKAWLLSRTFRVAWGWLCDVFYARIARSRL